MERAARRWRQPRAPRGVKSAGARYSGRRSGQIKKAARAATASAALDRLLHRATVINIKGDSYRLKEKRQAGLFPGPLTPQTTAKGGARPTPQ